MNRREFTSLAAAGVAGSAWALSSALAADAKAIEPWDPDKPLVVTGKPLELETRMTWVTRLGGASLIFLKKPRTLARAPDTWPMGGICSAAQNVGSSATATKDRACRSGVLAASASQSAVFPIGERRGSAASTPFSSVVIAVAMGV